MTPTPRQWSNGLRPNLRPGHSFRLRLQLVSGLLIAGLLSACGGGGGSYESGAPLPVAGQFPLEAAYKSLVAQGSSTDYTVSGTCSGTARLSYSVPVAGTLNGVQALVVSETVATAYTNCSPASSLSTSQTFYDAMYNPVATAAQGSVNGTVVTTPAGLPSLVVVGDQGTFATETLYSDSSLRVVVGRIQLDYVISADTDSSVLATLVSRAFDAANQLVLTQQTVYRLGTDGSFTALAIDLQYSTTSNTHLVFTRQL